MKPMVLATNGFIVNPMLAILDAPVTAPYREQFRFSFFGTPCGLVALPVALD
jgi:hypothetical protein